MNLKESFRYQSFLDRLMSSACNTIQTRDNCLTITKNHLKQKSNSDATDLVEVVEKEFAYKVDQVVAFIEWLVGERSTLSNAICDAKKSLSFNLDAAIETNKFRQTASASIKRMMSYPTIKKTERGCDYKFNNDGNQTPYYYDIEVVGEIAYDKENSKSLMRSFNANSDKTSSDIELAMINTDVVYTPLYDVNDTFEDVMERFVKDLEDTSENE